MSAVTDVVVAPPVALLPSTRRISPGAVLAVASLGAFLTFLDATIVNVAFPDLRRDFPDSSVGDLSWVLNAYNVVFAAALVAAGRFADLLGRRRMFSAGVAVFTLASVGCALAGSIGTLTAMRTLQALGAAMLVPASLALVMEVFPPERRSHAVGIWGAAAALAAGLGPPIGGLLVEVQGWRLAFLVNLPLGLAALGLARRIIPESRAPGRRTLPDTAGAGLLALSLGSLTLAAVNGGTWGWVDPRTATALVVSTAAGAAFARRSRRHPSPVLDPELLRIRPFAVASVLTAIGAAGFYAYLLTHVLWLTNVWRYSVLEAGLAVAPGALVAAVVAGTLGKRADRRGARPMVLLGALLWAASFGWYLGVVETSPDFLGAWLPGQVLSGIGVGLTLPVLAAAAVAAVPNGRYATASAVVTSTRQLGGVLGISALVVLLGELQPERAEAALRSGWLMSALCFLAVAAGAPLLGGRPSPPELLPDEPPLPARQVRQAPAQRADGQLVRAVEVSGTGAESTAALLRAVPLFQALDNAVVARLSRATRRVTLPAGEELFREGDAGNALYVVAAGRAEVSRSGALLTTLGRGAVLGELALLTGEPRAATVRARRDLELLRLPRSSFETVLGSDPRALRSLATMLATQVQAATPPPILAAARPTVVAVVGLDPLAPVASVGELVGQALARTARVTAPRRTTPAGLEQLERCADVVLLSAGGEDADVSWREFCLRQADRLLLVASAGSATGLPLPDELRDGRCDLLLVGRGTGRSSWHDAVRPRACWVTELATGELSRAAAEFADRVLGRSVGLVLSGGGARALAHIGVLHELTAAGLRIDRVAGVSMGSLVAGLFAMGLTPEQIDARCYEELVRRNPANDYTFPRSAVLRGRKGQAMLSRCFGDVHIEDLPREFHCVSCDLLERTLVRHSRGGLAEAVAASVCLPGIFPPQQIGDRVLVDGGLVDNLPVDPLLERPDGPVIAVNVSMSGGAGRGPRVPSLGETVVRSLTIASTAAGKAAKDRASLLIAPRARGVGMLEFHQIDAVIDAGRAATRDALASDAGRALLANAGPV